MKVLYGDYIPDLDCDGQCGSTTYGFIHSGRNIFYKWMRYVICGGCGKIQNQDVFERLNFKCSTSTQESQS